MIASEFTEQVLVLKVGTFRESDCWVRFFSPKHGLATAFAFGGAKSRRRFCGCLDPLNHVLFKVARSRRSQYMCLEEGTLLNGFRRLRSDQQRVGAAVNCIHFLETVHVGHHEAVSAYGLFLEILKHLDGEEGFYPYLPLYFRAALACLYGYAPQLSFCNTCGERPVSPEVLFSVDGGRIYCQKCPPPTGKALRVSVEAADILSIIADQGPLVAMKQQPSRQGQQDFFRLVEAYVEYHLGISTEGRRFRRL